MTKQIPLTQGQTAIVCDCHAHLVEGHKWYAHWDLAKRQFIAMRGASRTERRLGLPSNIKMHTVINRTPKGFQTDHQDNNSLNNQCSNLRTATNSENKQNRTKYANNTSGFKGVSRDAGKWKAQIKCNGKRTHLGLFYTPEEAARAYDAKAKKLHGAFANLNFNK